MKKCVLLAAGILASTLFIACKEDPVTEPVKELSEEYYAGGKKGTAFNRTSLAYEQPAPAVTDMAAFKRGEKMFETKYVTGEGTPYSG